LNTQFKSIPDDNIGDFWLVGISGPLVGKMLSTSSTIHDVVPVDFERSEEMKWKYEKSTYNPKIGRIIDSKYNRRQFFGFVDYNSSLKVEVKTPEDVKNALCTRDKLSITSCTELLFPGLHLSNAAIATLASALTSNSSITLLDLSYNNMTDRGACLLADVLSSNTALNKLLLVCMVTSSWEEGKY